MVNIELASKITSVGESLPLEENTATHTYNHVHSSEVISVEEEGYKTSFIKENTVVSVSSTNSVLPVELQFEHKNDQILSMTKLEDIENFMDTLLDSKLEESSLDDPSENVPHETELSTAKPLTDVQLMDELFRINEKLSLKSVQKSSSNNNVNTKDKNDEVKKRESTGSSMPTDSCIGNFYCLRLCMLPKCLQVLIASGI